MIQTRGMRWWDIPDVHELERKCFPQDTWTRDQFWQELAQPTRRYLVAVTGQQIVGYAGAFIVAPDSDVQTLAVDPDFRAQGIGQLLVEGLFAVAGESGATAMVLEVRADNAAAIGLYERNGFVAISRRSRYYPDGSDALILQRRPVKPA